MAISAPLTPGRLNDRSHNAQAKAPKPKKTGASRVLPKRTLKERLQFVVRLFALLSSFLLILAVAAVVVWLQPQEKLKNITNRPIASVQIDGEFLYLSKDQAQELIGGFIHSGFLKLDIDSLKSALEQNPWVDYVSVARQWPDVLKVTIVEQQPIARWGEDGFLNMRGDIVFVNDNHKLQSLPYLYGDDRYAKQVMQQYLFIAKLFGPSNRVLTSLQLDPTLSWTLEFDHTVQVKLGRDRVLEKLQHLQTASSGQLKDRFGEISGIDMRYDKGFAVTWKDAGDERVAATEG